jgi:uroporphyrinogen-III synthase
MTVFPDAAIQEDRGGQKKGLAGRRIVITRAQHQAAEMASLIEGWGGIAESYPCIVIQPAQDNMRLDRLLSEAAAGRFDLLVITSANTAFMLAEHLARRTIQLAEINIVAVGPKTAAAVKDHLGIEASYVAQEHVAERLVEEMLPVNGSKILLPQSSIARPYLAEALSSAGAVVTTVTVYETGIGQGGADVPGMLAAGQIDAVTFTSPSTVSNFLARLDAEGGQRSNLEQVCLAAIGPVTAEAMKSQDLSVDVMPAQYTASALVNSLVEHFGVRQK